MVYEYFQIVTRNSTIKKKNLSFEDIEKLSVKNMKICIEQYKERIKKFNEVFEKDNILELLEQSENEFISTISNPIIYSGAYREVIIDNFTSLMNRFQKHIRNENNYTKMINKFSVGHVVSWSAVLDAIKQAALIAALRKCKTDEVAVGLDKKENSINNDGIDNVFVADAVKYSYKKYFTSTTRRLPEFIIKFANGLDYSKLGENQIVVTSDLHPNSRPCKMKKQIESEEFLSGILLNIYEAKSDELQKNITYLKKIDYKCTDCISFDESDEEMEKNIEKFIKKRCVD